MRRVRGGAMVCAILEDSASQHRHERRGATHFVAHELRGALSFVKNVTITLDEETARWLRIEVAERNTRVSRLVGRLLRDRMTEDR